MIRYVFFKYGILLGKRDFNLFHLHFIEALTAVAWFMISPILPVLSIQLLGRVILCPDATPMVHTQCLSQCLAIRLIWRRKDNVVLPMPALKNFAAITGICYSMKHLLKIALMQFKDFQCWQHKQCSVNKIVNTHMDQGQKDLNYLDQKQALRLRRSRENT